MPYSIKNAVELTNGDVQIEVYVPNPRYRGKQDETREHPGTSSHMTISGGASMSLDQLTTAALSLLPSELAAIAVPGGVAGPKRRPDLEISVP